MRRPVLALLAVASLGLAACSSTDQGRATPQAGGTETSTTVVTTSGEAPPITGPELDLRRYVDKPCELLTSEQETQLNVEAGALGETAGGPLCDWKPVDRDDGTRYMVTILTEAEGGLEGVYRRKANFGFFEPAGEIGGYPAVHINLGAKNDDGTCTTDVGVMKDLVFEASVFVRDRNSSDYKNPCAVSDKLAELVVQNLKAGN